MDRESRAAFPQLLRTIACSVYRRHIASKRTIGPGHRYASIEAHPSVSATPDKARKLGINVRF